MAGISGDVDTLGILVGQTQTLVNGEPVLQRQQTKHGGRREMTAYDVLGKPSWQRVRGCTTTIEHGVVVGLRAFLILVPPLTQRRHVMRGNGTYRTIRIATEMTETNLVILRH